eukprot:6849034-Alexandrium_andersonii.AAC.1
MQEKAQDAVASLAAEYHITPESVASKDVKYICGNVGQELVEGLMGVFMSHTFEQPTCAPRLRKESTLCLLLRTIVGVASGQAEWLRQRSRFPSRLASE